MMYEILSRITNQPIQNTKIQTDMSIILTKPKCTNAKILRILRKLKIGRSFIIGDEEADWRKLFWIFLKLIEEQFSYLVTQNSYAIDLIQKNIDYIPIKQQITFNLKKIVIYLSTQHSSGFGLL